MAQDTGPHQYFGGPGHHDSFGAHAEVVINFDTDFMRNTVSLYIN